MIWRGSLNINADFRRDFFSLLSRGYVAPEAWAVEYILCLDNALDGVLTGSGKSSGYFRPPRHRRCFYFSPGANGAWAPGGHIAFKGFEPAAASFSQSISLLTKEVYRTGLPLFEHFVLSEAKAPLAVLMAEAAHEARIALEVHSAFCQAGFGSILAPFPICIGRHAPEVVENYIRTARSTLTKRAFRKLCEMVYSGGLGYYVYYFPTPCARPIDFMTSYAHLPPDQYIEKVSAELNIDGLVRTWASLLSKLLVLNFAPSSPESRKSGNCFDENNAVLTGGIVDLGSIVHVANRSDEWVRECIAMSLDVLSGMVVRLSRGLGADPLKATPSTLEIKQLLVGIVREGMHAYGHMNPRALMCFSEKARSDTFAIQDSSHA